MVATAEEVEAEDTAAAPKADDKAAEDEAVMVEDTAEEAEAPVVVEDAAAKEEAEKVEGIAEVIAEGAVEDVVA